MNIRITLRVEGKVAAAGILEIEDAKLEELTEEEVEQAVEIRVAEWANSRIEIDWEVEEEGSEG